MPKIKAPLMPATGVICSEASRSSLDTTTEKQGIFLSTKEYNGSIFLGTKTEEFIVNQQT
jgi:hypothetical protein